MDAVTDRRASTCGEQDAELPATSVSLPNFCTSSGTSGASHSTKKIGQEQSTLISLSWRPRPVQKGCLETGGLVHRTLEPSRDETHGLSPDAQCETNSAKLAEKA